MTGNGTCGVFTPVVCFLLGNSPGRLSSESRSFGTLYRFHLHGQVDEDFIHMPMKMETIEGSETSDFRTQTTGNYPKGNILYVYISLSLYKRWL